MWIALFAIGGAVVTFLAVIAFFAIILGCFWFFQKEIFHEIFDHPNALAAMIIVVILGLAMLAGTVGAIAGGIEGYHRSYGAHSVSAR